MNCKLCESPSIEASYPPDHLCALCTWQRKIKDKINSPENKDQFLDNMGINFGSQPPKPPGKNWKCFDCNTPITEYGRCKTCHRMANKSFYGLYNWDIMPHGGCLYKPYAEIEGQHSYFPIDDEDDAIRTICEDGDEGGNILRISPSDEPLMERMEANGLEKQPFFDSWMDEDFFYIKNNPLALKAYFRFAEKAGFKLEIWTKSIGYGRRA